jgi:two-component system sensor histidine kinase YesM
MLLINRWSEAQIKTEVHKAMSSQTRYYIETIERDLSRIMQRQSELVVNNNLLNVAFLPNFLSPREIQYNIQQVTREIAILKDTSDFVKDARIYVTDDQNSIFLSNSALFYLQKDIAEYFDIPDETKTSCIICNNNEYHLIMFYPQNIPIMHAKYLIDIELSGAAIRDTLDHMYMGENGLVLITSKDSSWLVTNTALESEPVDFVPSLISMSTSGTVKNGDSLFINNKYYVLYFENLDDFGLILFTLYPEQTIEKLRSITDSNNLELQPSGLVNVHKRIRLHFGEKSGLTISRSDLGGLKVAVNITKYE